VSHGRRSRASRILRERAAIWSALAKTISQRNAELKAEPGANTQSNSETSANRRSHTRELLLDRNLRLKKLGEESAELIAACAMEM